MAYTDATKKGLVPAGTTKPMVPALQQFDLSKINLVQLAADLSAQISRPEPKTWVTKIWRNHLIPHDSRRVSLLIEHVNQMQVLSESVTQMQYKLFIQPVVLENLLKGYYSEYERQCEIALREHRDKIREIEHRHQRRVLELRKLIAEVNELQARAREASARASLIEKVVKTLDVNQLPDYLKAYVISTTFNANRPITSEMQIIEQLSKLTLDKLQTELSRLQLQVERDAAETKAAVRDYENEL